MAGDWIKMRGALIDHPKVIAMTRWLQKHRPFRAWLTPGGDGGANGQLVSEHALRCVTTALLMRTWSIAREHGKWESDDLVLAHSEIHDLDQMAGAPGVGSAMEMVGWAIGKNGVTLPNFSEFNVPMTPAEKQKAYRTRHASGNGQVTLPLPTQGNEEGQNVTPREEKRREEKNKKKRILPPDFGLSPEVRSWADGKGFARLEERFEHFVGYAKRSGKTYADWDQALMCAIREDWAKLNGKGSPPSRAGTLGDGEFH